MHINRSATKAGTSSTLASAAIFFASALWGLYWFPIREIETLGLTGTWSLMFFNLLPCLVLIPWVLWQRHRLAGFSRQVLLVGGLSGTAMGLYGVGLIYSTVVRATLLVYLAPIWATVIGMLFLSEKAGIQRAVAVIAALIGAWLILSAANEQNLPLNGGDAAALIAGVLWAIALTAMKVYPHAPVPASVSVNFLAAALVATVVALFITQTPMPAREVFENAWLLTALTSVCLMLPSMLIIMWASRLVFPGRAGLLNMSEVLVAVASAALLIPTETMSALQWSGAALIVCGCILEVLRPSTS